MFMTLEKYRAMQRYDDARTRIGRIYGFILIARANAVSWKNTLNITVRASFRAFQAMTSPHKSIHPKV